MQTEKTLSSIEKSFITGFFPNYFKKIGIGILVLFFIPSLVMKLSNSNYFTEHKLFFRELTTIVFIVGLFFIAWSKEKAEDNAIMMIRYKAISLAFFFAVGWVIINPLVELIFNFSPTNKATDVVINMLMIYLFIFHLTKRAASSKQEV